MGKEKNRSYRAPTPTSSFLPSPLVRLHYGGALGPRHRTRAGWPRPISLDKSPSGPLKRPGRHPAACAAAHRPPGEQGYSGHPSGWRLLSVPISRGWLVDPAALAGPLAHLGSPSSSARICKLDRAPGLAYNVVVIRRFDGVNTPQQVDGIQVGLSLSHQPPSLRGARCRPSSKPGCLS